MIGPYQVIATLGPASATEKVWEDMIAAGASGFRINTSHLSLDELHAWLERLTRFFDRRAGWVPVTLDLQGSKWRLGQFEPFLLEPGTEIGLVLGESSGQPGILPVPHVDFFAAAQSSNGEIVLNDAKIRLQMNALSAERVQAAVVLGGLIQPRKGITFTQSGYRQERLNDKDRSILAATHPLPFARYALSYAKDREELENFCRVVEQVWNSNGRSRLIAKLERQPAVDQAGTFTDLVDEVWLCRGDLGAELGIPGMAEAAHRFSRRVGRHPVRAVLAGQVLEHMTSSPAATRSEVCALYDAISAGYQGVVLSDETAIGRYPVESCRTAAMFLV